MLNYCSFVNASVSVLYVGLVYLYRSKVSLTTSTLQSQWTCYDFLL